MSWSPESCSDCDFAVKELDRLGCLLGVFEEIDLEEEMDHQAHNICRMGNDGSFYLVGSQIPREGLMSKEPPVSMVRSTEQVRGLLGVVALYRYREHGKKRYAEYWLNPYDVPELEDEDGNFDEEKYHKLLRRLPEVEYNVLTEQNFTTLHAEHPRLVEYLERMWPMEKGDKVRMLGSDVHKLFARAAEESCPYGQRYGRPFHYTADEYVNYDLTEKHIDHMLPKGLQKYRVTYRCGHHATVVLKSGLGLRRLNKERKIHDCKECCDKYQEAYRKKLEALTK